MKSTCLAWWLGLSVVLLWYGSALLAQQRAADANPADDLWLKAALHSLDDRTDLTEAQRAAIRAAVTRIVTTQEPLPPSAVTEAAAITDPRVAARSLELVGRWLVRQRRPSEALPWLVEASDRHAEQLSALDQTLLERAQTESQLLRRDDASTTFGRLLRDFPNLPAETRASVLRQLGELEALELGSLDDVRDRMRFSGQQLAQAVTDEQLRAEQSRIVEMLDELIKQAQQSEGRGKGQGRKPGQGSGQGAGSGKPGAGAGEGPGKQGDDPTKGPAVRRLTRGGPQSPWGQLRDRQRDPAFSAIKEKFPARYQQMIEQYYQSFQEDR